MYFNFTSAYCSKLMLFIIWFTFLIVYVISHLLEKDNTRETENNGIKNKVVDPIVENSVKVNR